MPVDVYCTSKLPFICKYIYKLHLHVNIVKVIDSSIFYKDYVKPMYTLYAPYKIVDKKIIFMFHNSVGCL